MTTRERVATILAEAPDTLLSEIASRLGVSRQRVHQIALQLGFGKRRDADLATLIQEHHAEYRTWQGIIQRCTNARSSAFPAYGGRGITVCDRWLESFKAFLCDMGPRPDASFSIDRIDNDGPYAPHNCRWATRSQQASNQRPRRLKDGMLTTAEAAAFWLDVARYPKAADALALMTGWSAVTAFKRLGPRGTSRGRPKATVPRERKEREPLSSKRAREMARKSAATRSPVAKVKLWSDPSMADEVARLRVIWRSREFRNDEERFLALPTDARERLGTRHTARAVLKRITDKPTKAGRPPKQKPRKKRKP